MPDGGCQRMSLGAAEGVGVLMRFHIRWLAGGWEMWCAYPLCHARIENRPSPAEIFSGKEIGRLNLRARRPHGCPISRHEADFHWHRGAQHIEDTVGIRQRVRAG